MVTFLIGMGRSVAIGVWLTATMAFADGRKATEELDHVSELVTHAKYGEAHAALERLIEEPKLSAAQRNQALELSAILRIAERDMEAAREILATLYRRDPGHALAEHDPSPLVASVFARARQDAAATVQVALSHTVSRARDGGAYPVSVAIDEGLDAVHAVAVEYSLDDGMAARMLLSVGPDGGATGHIPLPGHDAHRVSYWVEALAPSGAVLARAGERSNPIQVRVPAAAIPTPLTSSTTEDPGRNRYEPRLIKQWWFWTLVGVAATATAASIGLAIARPRDAGAAVVPLH
jgi:hypothetical protein